MICERANDIVIIEKNAMLTRFSLSLQCCALDEINEKDFGHGEKRHLQY